MADSSQPGISLTVRPGSHAIFNPNGPWCAFPAPGDWLSIRKADGLLPVGSWQPAVGFACCLAARRPVGKRRRSDAAAASGIGCCLRVGRVISIAY